MSSTNLSELHAQVEQLSVTIDNTKLAMTEARNKSDDLTAEIDRKQAELDEMQREQEDLNDEYNEQRRQIAEQRDQARARANHCRRLEAAMRAKIGSEDPVFQEIYTGLAEYLKGLRRNCYETEERELLEAKRELEAPSPERLIAAKNELAELRKQRRENNMESSQLRQTLDEAFDELKQTQERIGNIVALQKPAEDRTDLLDQYNIPMEYRQNYRTVTRTNGTIDIYYGDVDDQQMWHGHMVIKNGKVVYDRRPELLPAV